MTELRWPVPFLTVEQRRRLHKQLSCKLDDEALVEQAIYRIDMALQLYRALNPARESGRRNTVRKTLSKAIGALTTLRLALQAAPQLGASGEFDKRAFIAELGRLQRLLEERERDFVMPHGRPVLSNATDRLIHALIEVYPNPKATRDGHFEKTVCLLLTFLGRSIDDVHSECLRALRKKTA